MSPQQYKPVILKALKDAQTRKLASVEELAESIVAKMDLFDEMLSLAGGQVAELPRADVQSSTVAIISNVDSVPIADVSERIVPAESLTDEEIAKRKQNAVTMYKNTLPKFFDIQPPSFSTPLRLNLLGIESSPGNLPMLRVKYAPQNASSEAMFVTIPQSVTDKILSSSELIEEVKRQGEALYSSSPRTVQTRMPPPIASLEQQLAGSPWADTDTETSAADLAAWNRSTGKRPF